MKHSVSIVRCNSYDEVESAIRTSVALLGGMDSFVKKGDKVLIKPNMLGSWAPKSAVTTHPAVVEAIIDLVLECKGKPSVGDSPAGEPAELVGIKSQIKAVCDKKKVPLVNLDKPIWNTSDNGNKYPISSRLDDFDLIINVPKLKTHMLTVMTGAVKNLFGCLPGLTKSQMHFKYKTTEDFSSMLLDIYTIVKPKLTIMDAVIGMDGLGPSNGSPKECNLILAGTDALALDTVASMVINIHDKVPMFNIAKKRNLEGAFMDNILVKGQRISDVAIPDFRAPMNFLHKSFLLRTAMSAAQKVLSLRPVVTSRCIACGKCKTICPARAIEIQTRAMIDYKKCIRCFCCYEVCPHKAIVIKQLFFTRQR